MPRFKIPASKGTSEVIVTGWRPKVMYRSRTAGSVFSVGTLLLAETAHVLGLVKALDAELGAFTRRGAVHAPGKAVCDVAVILAAGGECPAVGGLDRAIAP